MIWLYILTAAELVAAAWCVWTGDALASTITGVCLGVDLTRIMHCRARMR